MPNLEPTPPTRNGTVAPPVAGDHQPTVLAGLRARSLTYADLAIWLLTNETGGRTDAMGLGVAAERVIQKLSLRLATLVSRAGSQAILSRALHLVRAEFPFLDGVDAGTVPEACLPGLAERLPDLTVDEARLGLLAVLSTLLDLLVEFIGEDLTLRLAREVWPDLPRFEPIGPGNFDGQEATA